MNFQKLCRTNRIYFLNNPSWQNTIFLIAPPPEKTRAKNTYDLFQRPARPPSRIYFQLGSLAPVKRTVKKTIVSKNLNSLPRQYL